MKEMKNLTLGISGLLLLAIQVNAKQVALPTPPAVPESSVMISRSTSKVNKSRTVSTTVNNWSSDQDQDQSDDPMKTKTFSKSFSIDKNDKVSLSNQYGSITIKTWDKKEVKLDADIKVYANTDSEAQKLIDDVSISSSKSDDGVVFKTNMGDMNGNWGRGNKNGKKWRREIKVSLTLYMPSTNALTVAQSFGNVNMENFAGPTSLKVEYGNLTTGVLSNVNNYVSVQFGKAEIEEVNQATIKHEYGSGLTLGSANTLKLSAQFTGVKIGTIKNSADIKHEYGAGLTIEKVGSLILKANFIKVKILALAGNGTINAEYGGGVTIDQVEAGCKKLDINAHFAGINLGFSLNLNADLDISTQFGGFKSTADGVEVKRTDENKGFTQSKAYTGKVGKGGTSKINVKTEYGSVSLK